MAVARAAPRGRAHNSVSPQPNTQRVLIVLVECNADFCDGECKAPLCTSPSGIPTVALATRFVWCFMFAGALHNRDYDHGTHVRDRAPHAHRVLCGRTCKRDITCLLAEPLQVPRCYWSTCSSEQKTDREHNRDR